MRRHHGRNFRHCKGEQQVDLATGVYTPKPNHLRARDMFVAARLPHGCVVCAGGAVDNFYETWSTADILQPPTQGATDTIWIQRELPALSVERFGCCGCVLSDGRFAVLGGMNSNQQLSSYEALTLDHGEHWEYLPPMHDARTFFGRMCGRGWVHHRRWGIWFEISRSV